MIHERPFSPDWVSPPGETIATLLKERGLSAEDFAQAIRSTPQDVEQFLDGSAALTSDLAQRLADSLGASAGFWSRREVRYRQDLERLLQEAARAARLNWLDEVPVKDMIGLGWIKPLADAAALAAAVLRFFGVPSVDSWRSVYHDALHPVAFRTSSTFESQPGAIAAWLRQGEHEAASIHCERWDPDKFKEQLQVIRGLTRERDPQVFLPELRRLCAECGVAVVALRAPKNCRASGASRFLSPGRPLLMLSFRYLSDDHLWFTFFHEAGHLLLHADSCLFLEGDDRLTTAEEEEANSFAANTLIPPKYHPEMLRLRAEGIPVVRFAKKVGIAPGIVVGQLQHLKRIGQRQLNNLKRRYQWTED
jgi:plasmid maintenance system antidote protein VapI/Zn-dependent peptidase ImmA (M78 family)